MENELREVIKDELEELRRFEVGTEEYTTAVNGITKLMNQAIEIEKLNSEIQEKIESRETELDLKLKQMEEEKKDRKVRNILAALGIGIPAVVSIWGTLKTLEFEKIGTITTMAGREHIRKVFNLFKK